MESSPSLRHTPEHAGATITADGIVCARTIDASNDVLAAAEGGLIVAILRSETAGSELALDLLNIHR